MRQKHRVTAVAIFALIGMVSHSQSVAEAWQGHSIKHLRGMMAKAASVSHKQQGPKSSAPIDQSERESLIHKVGTDAYSEMSSRSMRPEAMSSPQAPTAGSQPRTMGEYNSSSPGNQGGYSSNPSDNYFKKESFGPSSGPYGGSVYGTGPTTPSADPMIKELNRNPSIR